MQPDDPREKYSRAVVDKINQKKMTVEQVWQYGEERCSDWYSPVTSLTEYQADKDTIVVYAAFAGAPRDEKTASQRAVPTPAWKNSAGRDDTGRGNPSQKHDGLSGLPSEPQKNLHRKITGTFTPDRQRDPA